MAKEKRKSVFNVAVIGLSGTEQVRGMSGIGKSCLCNRFVREEADEYYPDHTSILSQSDFGGRVVNNDHFLYWGEVTKQDDNGQDYKFNVIEQTEFIDDQSYQAHRSSSNQSYHKRSAQTKITSAEKLMYICTDQLGIEGDFDQKPMPDGKLTIDGFVICYDVSRVTNRSIADQAHFVQQCYHCVAKTKKPVVIALTKCDEADSDCFAEAEKFAANAGGKKSSGIPVIETSASENINVTLAFFILAQLIDKTRSKSKIINFDDAAQVRKELLKGAKDRLGKLLEDVVKDYHASWQVARKELEGKPQYQKYVKLEGKTAASKTFRDHVKLLRTEYQLNLQNEYMRFFSKALKKILPDLTRVRTTWSDTLQVMIDTSEFSNWIVKLDDLNNGANGMPWYEDPHVDSLEDRRIPFELLHTAEAERQFLFHRQDLEAWQRRSEMKASFREMLSQSNEVTPGRDWVDVSRSFKQELIADLSDAELQTMYEQYQSEIIDKAKKDFQELLFEESEIFATNSNATHMDIEEALQSDSRYAAMAHLRNEKDEILTRHIAEAHFPPADDWGAQSLAFALKSHRTRRSRELPACQFESLADRWQLTPDSDTLNIVLLGTDGLSRELANEITIHSSEEFTVDGCIHRLRLRSVDGDVSLSANSFRTSSFFPHGCIAVYSSLESLDYIESSLENTVVISSESLESENIPPFQGLPVSILLASYSNSQKEVHQLRDAGERLATRLGCPFIDVLPPEYAYNRRFHESQIKMAMNSLINGIKDRAGSKRHSGDNAEEEEDDKNPIPDLKLIMCTRKDDFQTAEMALAPLLNHTSFQDPGEEESGEESECTVQVETYLGTQRRRIAVSVTSYRNARNHLSEGSPVHGFILVYDTLLKSSFSIMKVFANNTASSYPLLILCISPDDKKPAASFFQQDPASRQLLVDGNNLADKLKAKFVSASAQHRRQSEVYSTFFKDAWEHKEETESIHNINRAVVEEDVPRSESIDEQPSEAPVPAPRSNFNRAKANSTEQLVSKPLHDYGVSDTSVTPPSTLKLNFSAESYVSTRHDFGRTTPGSAWSVGSDETPPNTSPSAGLLDNEVNPDYSDYALDPHRKTSAPPVQSSHLYPGGSTAPGKLNPDLVNKVAAGIGTRKTPTNFEDVIPSLTNSDPPYMSIHDHSKSGAVKVLPSPGDIPQKSLAKSSHETKSDSKLMRLTVANGYENETQRRGLFGKRFPLKSVDLDSTSPSSRTPPTVRQTRHSTADLLYSSHAKVELDGARISKKSFGGSHEDLLHPSPSVPSGLSTTGLASGERISAKDKFPLKRNKDEKKKEEKKNKEKEQRFRYKEKSKHAARNPPAASVAIGNKHIISDYFNKGLDDIIQSLNHLVPLFAEKCVFYIESCGLTTEGLYRVPANTREREMIITKFDEDNNYDLTLSEVSVHTVAGCLTWFFSHKNLPEPLMSTHLHDELEEAVSMPSAVRNLAIRGVVRKLPYSNYATFKYICTHLKNVSDHSEENKMTVENLAICWCNTLFRPIMDGLTALPKGFYKDVLMTCIRQCGFMFYDQPEQ